MTPAPPDRRDSDRTFYDRIADAYDWLADANERPARRAGVKLLGPKSGEAVLELGFGTGNEVLELAGLVGAGGRVAGIDVSPGMLAVAQRKVAANPPAAKVDLSVCDARELAFPPASFDAAYTSFTLELFAAADIPVVLAGVRRVLKPGGRLGVVSMATPNPGQPDTFLEKTYVWMHRHFPHIVDCRPIDVRGVVEAAGFAVSAVEEMTIWTMPVRAVVGVNLG
ncbi:MAG: 2-heptaprenyl-1,4-naphthoquinone methyltransferase [Isosphaera sp.]|nr:2-heptaprenyl-1,4-naphthoquinone methyltransferase [Isosphaera sp.]